MELERLRLGANVGGDSGNPMNSKPEWLDIEKFRRGQKFFCDHSAAIISALHCFLCAGFGIGRLLTALVFNKASDTPAKALRRYMETYVHVVLWHVTDVWDSTTPSRGHSSLAFVRNMHKRVAQAMTTSQMEEISPNEQRNSSMDTGAEVNISQYDMALVQSGFVASAVMYPRSFGIRNVTRNELEDYIHFWRGIGYLLGIEDQFNICSNGLDSAISILREIEQEAVLPGLYHPPADFFILARAYCDGMNRLYRGWFPIYSIEATIAFILEVMQNSRFKGRPAWLRISWADYFRILYLRAITFFIAWSSKFEKFINYILLDLALKKTSPLVEKQLSCGYRITRESEEPPAKVPGESRKDADSV